MTTRSSDLSHRHAARWLRLAGWPGPNLAAVLEELNGPLVLLGCFARGERAEIPAFARLRVDAPRIKPVLTRPEFADHLRLLRLLTSRFAGWFAFGCVPSSAIHSACPFWQLPCRDDDLSG